jgi:ABC-type transport system involved in multi-copper enzyme maturation permease subunit
MVAMETRVLSPAMKSLLRWLAEFLPNFNLFVPGQNTLVSTTAAYGEPLNYIATSMGYAVLYAGATLFIAALIFRRRDFL